VRRLLALSRLIAATQQVYLRHPARMEDVDLLLDLELLWQECDLSE
jgi:hypothetical protein